MPEFYGGDCAQARNRLGVYLLGAIGPAERAEVELHLAACPWCREELAGLAGLPGLLRRVPPDMTLQVWMGESGEPVPGPPLDTLIGRVRRIRFRRRLMAVAAALVFGVAAAAGVQVLHARPASTVAAAPRWTGTTAGASAATGAWAAVRYAVRPWGTELEVRVTGIPVGTRCQLRVINAQGQSIAAGGWVITAGSQRVWYPASVPWPAARLRGFAVNTGGKILVSARVQ
jgi:hypothetical protein